MDRPWIVVGLGNPGLRYRSTRHNLGFLVVERMARQRGLCFRTGRDPGRNVSIAEFPGPDGPAVLAKPRTFMNQSGRAGVALSRWYGALPEDFVVVYDDADLALGRIRVRPSGSAGGHNGVASLIEAWASDRFPRVRLGIGSEEPLAGDLADHVLQPFLPEERPVAEELVKLAAKAADCILTDGVTAAMNRYNSMSVAPTGGGSTDD